MLHGPIKLNHDSSAWNMSRSNVTHRKSKWFTRSLIQLVVGGTAFMWQPRLPDVTYLPTFAQFEAATANKGITTVDCIRLTDPTGEQTFVRLVDKIAHRKMMTLKQSEACQTAMNLTIRLNKSGAHSLDLQYTDEWRQTVINNLNWAIAHNGHLPLKPPSP